MLRQLSQDEIQAVIASERIGRIGCISDGMPYVVPVSYLFSGDKIYVHSLHGRKVAAMRANPRVCFQVDHIEDEYHWRSVILFGEYQEVPPGQERDWAMRELLAKFPNLTPVESIPVHDGSSEVILFRILIKSLSGRGET